jgi:putative transposase
LRPAEKRSRVDYLKETFQVSLGRACEVMDLSRSVYYYQSKKDDRTVIDKLQGFAEKRPTEGFWKMYFRIRKEGLLWNHKRIHRVYKSLKLNMKRKGKRRLPARILHPLEAVNHINASWSMDFMSDSLLSGRKFRVLNILDDFNREALTIEVDTSLTAERVIRSLEQTIQWRGKPQRIRVDNGPEFISSKLGLWCEERNIHLQFIQPGKPSQNAYIERFNGSFRRDVLDAYLFESLNQVRIIAEEWMHDYNYNRPHDALNGRSPVDMLVVDLWKTRDEFPTTPQPDIITTTKKILI